jgi:hypothetical protein
VIQRDTDDRNDASERIFWSSSLVKRTNRSLSFVTDS